MKIEFTLLIDNIIKMRETMINHLKHFEGKTLDEKSLSKKIFLEFMLMDLEVLLSNAPALLIPKRNNFYLWTSNKLLKRK